MKASRYNLIVDREDGGALLYNCLRGSLSSWEPDERPALTEALAAPSAAVGAPLGDVLMEQGNLVDDEVDEVELVRRRRRAGVTDPNRLDVVIMPTLQCNFACPYCYEEHRGGRMSDETEARLVAWLETELPRHRLVLIHWFGGEPLLCPDTVLRVSRAISEAGRRADVVVSPHVTTNGYFLDSELASQLADAGVLDYQITIDGPPDVHDAARPLRGGGATFDRVFGNMLGALRCDPRVTMSMRTNFNHTNLSRIPELLERVPKELRSRIRVVFEPIFGDCSINATDNLLAEDIVASLAQHHDLARRAGFAVADAKVALEAGKLVYCYAEREHQVVVNANGDLFKCSVCSFEPEERVGWLEAGRRLERDAERWSRWVAPEDLGEVCLECTYLPLCMGGCRKVKLAPETRGSCSLVATNASYVLKLIALGGQDALRYGTDTLLEANLAPQKMEESPA